MPERCSSGPLMSTDSVTTMATDGHTRRISITSEGKIKSIMNILQDCQQRIDWSTKGPKLMKQYRRFVTHLISAHSVYLAAVLTMLAKNLLPSDPPPAILHSNLEELVAKHEATERSKFTWVHETLGMLLHYAPVTPRFLLPILTDCFPWIKRSSYVTNGYVKNLLEITGYLPELRVKILELIIHRMMELDDAEEEKKKKDIEAENVAQEMAAALGASLNMHNYSLQASTSSTEDDDCQTTSEIRQEIQVHDEEKQLLQEEVKMLSKQVEELKSREMRHTWSVDKIKQNDRNTKFYTGLPNWATFVWLFNILLPFTSRMKYYGSGDRETKRARRPMSLPLQDQLLATLMRLKVGLFLTDLSDRFNISLAQISRIVKTWIFLMEKVLAPLNPSPDVNTINQSSLANFIMCGSLSIVLNFSLKLPLISQHNL